MFCKYFFKGKLIKTRKKNKKLNYGKVFKSFRDIEVYI